MEGSNSWGSTPDGIKTSTRARSPATLRTMSPKMEVVAKITVSLSAVTGTFSSYTVPPPSPPPQAAAPKTAAASKANPRSPPLICFLLLPVFANLSGIFYNDNQYHYGVKLR